jgi:formylglycine-generating enzyme required for sulfatase activity
MAAGLDASNEIFAAGEERRSFGTQQLEAKAFAAAAGEFRAAHDAYRTALAALHDAPEGMLSIDGATGFLVGSRPEEVEAALALCRRYRPACARSWYESETLREVAVDRFAIDRHEVTNREFMAFVEDTGHVTSAEERGHASRWNGSQWEPAPGWSWRSPEGPGSDITSRMEHPAVNVSREDAAAYCAWVGGRLPSEEEWELAARGSERRTFPWGENWDPARVRFDDASGTAPVGSSPLAATPEGVQDLAGGVWEWTSGSAGDMSVLKGGSFDEPNPANLRSAARRLSDPGVAHPDDGFRCARSID